MIMIMITNPGFSVTGGGYVVHWSRYKGVTRALQGVTNFICAVVLGTSAFGGSGAMKSSRATLRCTQDRSRTTRRFPEIS